MSEIIYVIGVIGIIINRRNIIIMIMSMEMMLMGGNIGMCEGSVGMGDIMGESSVLLVLTVAACEAGIGLSMLMLQYKREKSIRVEEMNIMEGEW
ncbi:NADH dehydrogenase subunit 4L (mitochondrion) [Galdieria partita]|uniref:NADH-ubiquinone oxidoreductase chain 4L n=1 Tax=Galdieria partita TaxID=83374 RepID=A0A9C7BCQ1_9RHOD|nr:NADH dehydrogenase subunit 4L [Galdieria partita]